MAISPSERMRADLGSGVGVGVGLGVGEGVGVISAGSMVGVGVGSGGVRSKPPKGLNTTITTTASNMSSSMPSVASPSGVMR